MSPLIKSNTTVQSIVMMDKEFSKSQVMVLTEALNARKVNAYEECLL